MKNFIDLSETEDPGEINSVIANVESYFKKTLNKQIDFHMTLLNGIVEKLNYDFTRYLKRSIKTNKGGKIKFINISVGLNIHCYMLIVFPNEEEAFSEFVSAIRGNKFKSDNRHDNIFLKRMWGIFIENYEQYRDPQKKIIIKIKALEGNEGYEKIAKWLQKYFEAFDWEVNLMKCAEDRIYEEWFY